MRFLKFTALVFTAAVLLCFSSPGLAYKAEVEIVTIGTYPDAAMPPGEAVSIIDEEYNILGSSFQVKLDAVAYSGWVFLGWEFGAAFYARYEQPTVNQYVESDGTHFVADFELHDDFTAMAVFTYVGPGSVFYELQKMNPAPVSSGEAETAYEVGVYERDPLSVDGDYGAIFCYPYSYGEKMDVPAGSVVLLAAMPYDGFAFSHWAVFKDGKGFEQSPSNVLAFIADTPYSIDAIFTPAARP